MIEIPTYEELSEKVKELQQSLAFYRSLVDSTQDLLYRTDLDGVISYISPSVYRLSGYTVEEAIGMRLAEEVYLNPEERKGFLAKLQDKGQVTNFEAQLKRKDGSVWWASTNAHFYKDRERNIIGVEGTTRDITERKQMEQDLRDSESRLKALSEASFEAIFLSEKGLCLDQNNTAEEMFGYTRAEAVGRPGTEWIVPEDREQVKNKMLSGDENQYEVTALRKDGTTFPCEIQARMLNYKGHTTRVTSLRDITERKRVEATVRESVDKYRRLIQNALVGVYQVSYEGRFITVNQKMAEMFDYGSPDKFLAEVENISDLYARPEERPIILKELDDKGFVANKEVEFRTKDGKPLWIKLYTTVFKDNNTTLYEGLMQDMTEQKKLEAQFLQSQKMESIGNLAGGIAHDFNNILSSLLGFTELALDDVPKGTSLEDHIHEVYTAGKRARDLVKQILAFARQSEEEVKPIKIGPIINDSLKLLRSSIPTTIEIKKKIESDSLILGNPIQVDQIVMNICTNAAHVMEDQGGILDISLKDFVNDRDEIWKALDLKKGDYIELKISDTGPGIAPQIMGSIFEPYFTTKGPGEGTGMGLALVHGIVESYYGKIKVDSALGKGSTFTVYLPTTQKRKTSIVNESEQLPLGTESILFVDDESPIAKMGSQILNRLGYSVTARTSSLGAVELFRAKPNEFDLVITDMTMPNMSGDKLAIELMKIRSDIPIILCTGYSKKISDELAKEIGIKAFAYKPIVKADLAKTVRKVLDEAKSETQVK